MTVPLLVVRHGQAGERELWEGPDERRPLDAKGRRQAAALVDVLAPFPVERILSSWYTRCLESVVHLACDRRLPVDVDDALVEGSSVPDVVALARKLAGTVSVVCTHGDVILNMLWGLAGADGLEVDEDPPLAKGSTWVLEALGDRFVRARYIPAP